MLKIIVRFAHITDDLHTKMKAKSVNDKVNVGTTYNDAMESFSDQVDYSTMDLNAPDVSQPEYTSKRVTNIDKKTYIKFKVTCLKKEISVSQGMNLAIIEWTTE